jgi:hypothetical protein
MRRLIATSVRLTFLTRFDGHNVLSWPFGFSFPFERGGLFQKAFCSFPFSPPFVIFRRPTSHSDVDPSAALMAPSSPAAGSIFP